MTHTTRTHGASVSDDASATPQHRDGERAGGASQRHVPDWLDWDDLHQVLTIDGCKIAREQLAQFTISQPGIRFRIIKRADGVITVGYERSEIEAAAPELFEAAKAVLAGLNARIDQAPMSAVPVFDGIAALSAAIARIESAEITATAPAQNGSPS